MSSINQDMLDVKEDPRVNVEILKERFKKRRRLLFIVFVSSFIICISVISIVVPVVLSHRNHSKGNQISTPGIENVTTNPQTMTRFYSPSQGSLHPPIYAHSISPYANLTRLKILEPASDTRRIFIMGDIHGCLLEMNQLLNQIQFDPLKDIIVLTGDLVYRGEASIGVIRRAKEIGAYCVRGNHDDKVLRLKSYELAHGIKTMSVPEDVMPEGDVIDPIKFGNKHSQLAKDMNVEEYDYLAGCPLIIDIPEFKARVVHGGLDPFIPDVVDNDPWSVLNMRDIDENNQPSKLKISTVDNNVNNWTKVYQRNNPRNITVYYGHDASRGLVIENSTVGLDSGCVHGRQLSVIEIKSREITQVNCKLRGSSKTFDGISNRHEFLKKGIS